MPYSSHNFPADLLPDLLSRLPAKTLLKFKSVSKLWLSIIEDPKFTWIHTKRVSDSACQSTSSITQLCLSRFYFDSDEGRVSKVWEINWSGGIDVVAREFCPIPDVKDFKLVGSSNGVLCIVCTIDELEPSKFRLILWNPLSRKYHIIPPPPGSGMQHSYGFGYDKVNDDYKIVSFETSSITNRALVYSKKMNTWRAIDIGFPIPSLWMGVLCGGALHWILDWNLENDSSLIVFDLAKEELNRFIVFVPEDVHPSMGIMRDDRLCMMIWSSEGSYAHVRLMLNHNEWKEFRFEPERDGEPKSDICHDNMTPIAYVESPKPIMVMMEWRIEGNNLVFYDVKEQSLIFNSQIGNIDSMVCDDEVFTYIQTLELYK